MIIVTHINPDLDAITSVWLLKRFKGGDFKNAEVKYLPAGETYQNKAVDSDDQVVHVDTGLGKFDHHQTDRRTCAARLVYEYLSLEDEALQRLVTVVEAIDFDAADIAYPEAVDDRYAFFFNERQIMAGWYSKFPGRSDKIMKVGLIVLDGVYEGLKAKMRAEEVFEKATTFMTRWGKGIAAETSERGFLPLAFSRGYAIGVSKDPKWGNVRIKGWGSSKIDLTKVYEQVKKADRQADWFFHASRKMLLNGSRTNPKMQATKLSLEELVKFLSGRRC